MLFLTTADAEIVFPHRNMPIVADKYGVFLELRKDSSVIFIAKGGKSYRVKHPFQGIAYIGGTNRLKRDMASATDIGGSEENILAVFYILFDKKLKIIEIRSVIVSPKQYNRDDILTKYNMFIKSTDGHWKADSRSRFYLYSFYSIVN